MDPPQTPTTLDAPDLEADFNVPEEPDYEEKRSQLKLNTWKSSMLLFQGTMGLSLFTIQKPLQMVGLIWGIIITIITGYITCYGLVRLSNLATEIEQDIGSKHKLKNFDELTRHINGPHIVFVKVAMMIAAVMMMYSSTVSNILLITTNIQQGLGWNEWVIKILIFLVIASVFIYLVEPEKIQYVNVYMTMLLMALAYVIFGRNVYRGLNGMGPKFSEIPLWKMDKTGVYAGNVAYAFEVASNYLSLRLTSASDVPYGGLTKWVLGFVGGNFYLCAVGNILAWKPWEVTENAFEMQSTQGGFWTSLVYIFMINTLYTFTFNTIFTSEIVESIPPIQRALTPPNATSPDRTRLILFRIALWLLAIIGALFSKNIIYILELSGSIFTPIVSYFGPMILFYTYESNKRRPLPTHQKVHDVIYTLVAMAISFWGILNAVQE